MRRMDRESVARWVRDYEAVWRTADVAAPLRALFHDDATYRMGPFQEAHTGLPAIERLWHAERAGPDEDFAMASEIVAVDDDIAVVRVEVRYGPPEPRHFLDQWLLRFAPDGRCLAFEEWPFWPGKWEG